MNSSR